MRAVILCGGRGTRLREHTEAPPKALVDIGGRPILWHIMKGYQVCGFSEFVLALGYKAGDIGRYFGVIPHPASTEATPAPAPAGDRQQADGGWTIIGIDTGVDTNTGGRIWSLRDALGRSTFFATYGDGVSDIDHRELLEFHRSHGKVATLTAVRPNLGFGVLHLDHGSRVQRFEEKPRFDGWINGGFFVFEPEIFDYLAPDSILEREPLERLAVDGQLVAYQHDGFWSCMDTYKDTLELNRLWSEGEAPWATWL